jgi:hypothetical protein
MPSASGARSKGICLITQPMIDRLALEDMTSLNVKILGRVIVQVLSVASEVYPLVKTGGLADVAGALPGALAAEGVEVAHARARLSP